MRTEETHGKYDTAKGRLQAGAFLVPAGLTAAAIALTVAAYQPLEFNGTDVVRPSYAEAAELQAAEATSEKESAEPTTDVEYSAADYGIDTSNLQDGVYVGSAQGFKSTITVQVTVSGGKITAIEVLSQADDASYFNRARAVISSVISSQSTSVDTVSGCTYSSKGILMAIRNALVQAQGSATSETQDEETAATEDKEHASADYDFTVPSSGLKDGLYYGTSEGYRSDITVSVTVEGGKITAVDIVSQDDDALYFESALGVIDRVLEAQSTSVDVVTGATYSSEGILGAVKNALAQAVVDPDDSDDADDSGTDSGDSDNSGSGSSSSSDSSDVSGAKYADGTYTAYAACANSADPDAFEPYYVALTLTVKNGQPVNISVVGSSTGGTGDASYGAYDTDNDDYLFWALDGRTFRGTQYVGVKSQLLAGTAASDIDVVARATYSSRAIAKAYQAALALAAKAYEEQNAASAGSGSAGESTGSSAGSGGSTGTSAGMSAENSASSLASASSAGASSSGSSSAASEAAGDSAAALAESAAGSPVESSAESGASDGGADA